MPTKKHVLDVRVDKTTGELVFLVAETREKWLRKRVERIEFKCKAKSANRSDRLCLLCGKSFSIVDSDPHRREAKETFGICCDCL